MTLKVCYLVEIYAFENPFYNFAVVFGSTCHSRNPRYKRYDINLWGNCSDIGWHIGRKLFSEEI